MTNTKWRGWLARFRRGSTPAVLEREIPRGQLYRNAVRDLCRNFRADPDRPVEDAFLEYLEENAANARERLRELKARRLVAAEDIYTESQGLLVLSSGLVAYGHLEAVDDVVAALVELDSGEPQEPESLRVPWFRRAAWVLRALLPLPEEMDPESSPDEFRAWMREHRARLRWDPELDRYILGEQDLLQEPQ